MSIIRLNPMDFQAGSIYNPANGDVVQFNIPYVPFCEAVEEVIEQENTLGAHQSGKEKRVKFGGLDVTDEKRDLIYQWAEELTPVQLVIASKTGPNVQFYDSVEIAQVLDNFKTRRADGDNALGVQLIAKNPENVHFNENLLAYLGWADSNSDGIPDNYTPGSAYAAFAFSSVTGIATARKTDTTADVYLSASIIFPIAHLLTTSSVAITAIGTLSYTNQLINTNFAGSTLGGLNSSLISAVGIRSIAVLSPASNYRVRVNMFNTGQTISDPSNISLKFPALTTNGKLTNGTEFMYW